MIQRAKDAQVVGIVVGTLGVGNNCQLPLSRNNLPCSKILKNFSQTVPLILL